MSETNEDKRISELGDYPGGLAQAAIDQAAFPVAFGEASNFKLKTKEITGYVKKEVASEAEIRAKADNNLQSKNSAQDERLNAMDTLFSEVQTNINNLDKRATITENNLTNLTTRVETNESNINALQGNITKIQKEITDLQVGFNDLRADVNTNKIDITDLQSSVSSINTQIAAINAMLSIVNSEIAAINSKISTLASPTNKVLSESEINKKLVGFAGLYITYDASGNNFPTKASLNNATKFYHAGQEVTPSDNDYCYVQDDESHNDGIGKYSFNPPVWVFEFEVPDVSFSLVQWAAINSGITAEILKSIQDLQNTTVQNLNAHLNDYIRHITATERSSWNAKQAALTVQQMANINDVPNKLATTIFNTHDTNNTRHITATERSSWNAKQAALTVQQMANINDVPNKLATTIFDTHDTNNIRHITALERSTWIKNNGGVTGLSYANGILTIT